MHTYRSLAFVAVAGLLFFSGISSALESYIPKENVERFVAQQLDLTTFRNSLGPRRQSGQRTFGALGIAPTAIRKNEIEFDTKEWYYLITIIRRADINNDGMEDLEVCFLDRAKEGTYHTSKSLLLTRFSNTGFLVALHFEVSGCPNYAK